ncbi:MAG: universal stress protein [Saprospiraceae bacterium]|nr:universal stress protein [Saprospiraceae bacterium]
MKAIKKILLPTDFSDTAQNAFRYCLRIADTYGAAIELLHVIYPEYQAMDIPVMAAKAMQDKVEAAKEVSRQFVDLGITQVQATYQFQSMPNIHAEIMIGNPVTVIKDIAKRDAADLIVMGTREKHNAIDKTFGSVTTGVIEYAPCPVWVIPSEASYENIDIIAYAAELNESDPYHIWKAIQVLEPFHPLLHCVHVGNGASSDAKMADMELFFTQNAPALQVNFHNTKGDAITDKLEEFAETYDVDVLVMYAPHHNLWQRIFLQSITKKMALQTSVPILFYKTSEN